MLDPVADRLGQGMGPLSGPVGAAAGALLAVEVGAVSGLLGQRVLGQYEFPILEPEAPARLLFVSPNLAQAALALEADADQLLRWVALHEITHALQFGGVPWLRPHIASMVRELLGGLDVDPARVLKLPDVSDLRSLVDKVREGDIATLIVGPERRAALDAMQAFMAVLEGYAEHVMDAVGAEILPDLPQLRGAMDRRRRDRSGLLRIFEKLIGMDLKLRQYELGKKFCDAVAEAGGIARPEPRVGGAGADADPRRARRSARLDGPHRAGSGCLTVRAARERQRRLGREGCGRPWSTGIPPSRRPP